MKKAILSFLAFLLLAGGGAGVYFYMATPAQAATGEEAPAEKAEGEAAEGAKITYVPMEAIVLPIIGRDGISQTISLVVSLEVKDEATAEKVKNSLPKLADAFLSDMYGTLSQASAMEYGVIKVSTLKTRLTSITDKLLGKDTVNGVLLQVLQQHPI